MSNEIPTTPDEAAQRVVLRDALELGRKLVNNNHERGYPMATLPTDALALIVTGAERAQNTQPEKPIPRRPWVLSKQYSWTFVLSQDNEIIIGDTACKYIGDDVLRFMIEAVNTHSPNDQAEPLPPDSERGRH